MAKPFRLTQVAWRRAIVLACLTQEPEPVSIPAIARAMEDDQHMIWQAYRQLEALQLVERTDIRRTMARDRILVGLSVSALFVLDREGQGLAAAA